MPDTHHTVTYAGVAEIARWCGVSQAAVSNWLRRYETYPVPDAQIGIARAGWWNTYGWLPERRAEWLDWQRGDRGPMVAS
jgi:Putative ATPase subunit of terminase (gpP-like)